MKRRRQLSSSEPNENTEKQQRRNSDGVGNYVPEDSYIVKYLTLFNAEAVEFLTGVGIRVGARIDESEEEVIEDDERLEEENDKGEDGGKVNGKLDHSQNEDQEEIVELIGDECSTNEILTNGTTNGQELPDEEPPEVEVNDLENDTRLNGSYVGSTFWSEEEKEKFFTYLGRKSKHDLSSIARFIGSKTLIECESYYELLKGCYERLKEQKLNFNSNIQKKVFVSYKDIPAAHEMSDLWIKIENFSADNIEGVVKDFPPRAEDLFGNAQSFSNSVSDNNNADEEYQSSHEYIQQDDDHILSDDNMEESGNGGLNEVDVDSSSVVNIPSMLELANTFFWNSEKNLPTSDDPNDLRLNDQVENISVEAVDYLESILKYHIKSLVTECFRNAVDFYDDYSSKSEVTLHEVELAIERTLLNSRMVEGRYSDESFWKEVCSSNGLMILNNSPRIVGGEYRHRGNDYRTTKRTRMSSHNSTRLKHEYKEYGDDVSLASATTSFSPPLPYRLINSSVEQFQHDLFQELLPKQEITEDESDDVEDEDNEFEDMDDNIDRYDISVSRDEEKTLALWLNGD